MFHNTKGTLDSVPTQIKEFYKEEVRPEYTGNQIEVPCTVQDEEGNDIQSVRFEDEYVDVTYVVLKGFGEIQDNVATLMAQNKPEELVTKFLGFVNNGIDKTYHDAFVDWVGQEPDKADVKYELVEDEQPVHDYAYDLAEWGSREPIRQAHKTLEDYSQYRNWKQLQGVEFDGVMCSATKQDFWGLSGAEAWIRSGHSTLWNFDNGNKLLLTPDNIDAFQAIWVPFRLSFFDHQ